MHCCGGLAGFLPAGCFSANDSQLMQDPPVGAPSPLLISVGMMRDIFLAIETKAMDWRRDAAWLGVK